ncbi:hypothetical protein LIER_42048 [Lithospermum erythrorhizon]|uniref:Retrotransposon gag protein n=1 Tax=Lithospermum erythrorhizon TaxID=34254 RepID=A0AAV3RK91_LITER
MTVPTSGGPTWGGSLQERIQRDRGQISRKQAHSPPPPPRGLVRSNQSQKKRDHNRYTPLRVSVAEIFSQVQNKNLMPKPERLIGPMVNRDKRLYCEYHREPDHDPGDCKILKAEIEKLIKRGYLKEFVGHDRPRPQRCSYSPPRERERSVRQRDKQVSPPRATGRIDTISGVIAGGGDSRNSRKNYSRRPVYSASNNQ